MSFLRINKQERVLRITLNRPEKRNALTIAMCHELVDAVEGAQDKVDIGSILMDAEGRAFCAGMDLDEAIADKAQESLAIHEKLFSLGRTSRKPIVACIAGPALGGGVGLVAQAHVAVAAQGALFGLTEIRSGLWPFLVYRSVEAAIGTRRVLELSLTGRLFSTQEGLSWGLIHQVVPAFEVEDRAEAVARELSRASPAAVRLGFAYVHESRGKSWEDAGKTAAALRETCAGGPDFIEGVAAFHEHREPRWPSMPSGTYVETSEPPAAQ
jgi:enoyl-CoA hydratase/carnithine racemase